MMRHRRRARRLSLVTVLVVVGLLVAFFWRLPYYTFSPGSMRSTQPLVEVSGAPTFPDDAGEIGYLTVRFSQASPFDLLWAQFDGDVNVLSANDALGGRDREENREVLAGLMVSAKDTATAVALDYLGFDVGIVGTGALVLSTEPGAPADGVLNPGDTVVAFDGSEVTTSGELIDLVASRDPGDSVVLGVQQHASTPAVAADTDVPGGPVADITVELSSFPDDPTRPFLGVFLATRDQLFDLPFDVEIDSGNVLGPSAGLAFTLAIIDVLTPGSLTGDLVVGVTGTMTASGTVGRVGGVGQKAAAAIDAGATLYLVPAGEADEARLRAGDAMEVVGVSSLDEALAALAERGGAPVAPR